MAKKKTWKEKLAESRDLPKVVRLTGRMKKRWGPGTMVIPSPGEVDALMRRVPAGKLTTIDQIRAELARQYGVTIACPLTTGIFAWIAAHAAEEAVSGEIKPVTPYWRVLKARGELNPKYPGGLKRLQVLLEAEGHKLFFKGSRCFVADYQNVLLTPGT